MAGARPDQEAADRQPGFAVPGEVVLVAVDGDVIAEVAGAGPERAVGQRVDVDVPDAQLSSLSVKNPSSPTLLSLTAATRPRSPSGAGREPAGQREGQVAELVGFLDDERQVERGEQRRQPPEVLHPQLGTEPGRCLAPGYRRGRQFLQGGDAGGQPGPDLLGRPLEPQADQVPVGGGGEPGQDALGRV